MYVLNVLHGRGGERKRGGGGEEGGEEGGRREGRRKGEEGGRSGAWM